MYRLVPEIKCQPRRRWALPDRIFFGHGACHILAGVYLANPPLPGFYAERIIPVNGLSGNHIFVTDGHIAFDYRGYSARQNLLRYHNDSCRKRFGPDWAYGLEIVDFDLLNTEDLNVRKMRGPDQYLHDPIPRACAFIDGKEHASAAKKAHLTAAKA